MRCAQEVVHIWRIGLDTKIATVAELTATLSAEERQRAERFRLPELRGRWTVARGALRSILATYIQSDPQSLEFRVGACGKLELARPSGDISFNLSHTGGVALLAIANGGRVGIDAESVCAGIEVEKICRHFLAPSEADEILALSPEAQPRALFSTWTRKEAFVKALGLGLSMSLARFRVTVRPEEPPQLVSVDWDEPATWSLVDVGEPNMAATLAVEGSDPIVRRFDFHHRLPTVPASLRRPVPEPGDVSGHHKADRERSGVRIENKS